MWIKALYCTEDIEYAQRLIAYFDKEYTNKIELNACSSVDRAMQLLKDVDIVLFGREYETEIEKYLRLIPCKVVIMTDQIYENTVRGAVQIEKYQRTDNIYMQLLDCYSTNVNVKKARVASDDTGKQRVYVFVSASGGVGTSTIAKSFASKCAQYEKTLYLDFGLFNKSEIQSGSEHGMDEVLLALKSRRNILTIKLSSAVAQSVYGYYCYGSCTNPMDLMNLNVEDIKNLMNEISVLSEYKRVIIDLGCALGEKELVVLSRAYKIVFVVDEKESSVRRFEPFINMIYALESRDEIKLARRLQVFRNMVDNNYGNSNWPYEYEISGWAPMVRGVESESDIISRIALSDSFNKLEN